MRFLKEDKKLNQNPFFWIQIELFFQKIFKFHRKLLQKIKLIYECVFIKIQNQLNMI